MDIGGDSRLASLAWWIVLEKFLDQRDPLSAIDVGGLS